MNGNIASFPYINGGMLIGKGRFKPSECLTMTPMTTESKHGHRISATTRLNSTHRKGIQSPSYAALIYVVQCCLDTHEANGRPKLETFYAF